MIIVREYGMLNQKKKKTKLFIFKYYRKLGFDANKLNTNRIKKFVMKH